MVARHADARVLYSECIILAKHTDLK